MLDFTKYETFLLCLLNAEHYYLISKYERIILKHPSKVYINSNPFQEVHSRLNTRKLCDCVYEIKIIYTCIWLYENKKQQQKIITTT